MPSNGTIVKIFIHPENDLDGELYVHVRYDMDLMINSNAYEILLIWFVVIFFSSPDPKGHVRYCHHLASVVRRPSVNFSYFNLLL